VQAAWYLKCRALTLKNWIDDTEIEEEVTLEEAAQPAAHHRQPEWVCKPADQLVFVASDGLRRALSADRRMTTDSRYR
jgi:hypothetical protein